MNKKNLVRISVVITKQTLGHLDEKCAMCGWNEKQRGRVIDKMMRNERANERAMKDAEINWNCR